jgi:Flp pilus assembly protein TadG
MPRFIRSRSTRRGQALVETALVLPLFLMLLVGVVDMGRAVWATTSLDAAAREATRFAIVHGGSALTPCPVGTWDPSAIRTVIADASCPNPSPSKQSIMDAATNAAIAGGSNVTVTVCYGAGCTGNTDTNSNGNRRGESITVVVTSTVNLIVPALLGRSSFALSGNSTMLVNH